MRLRDLFMDGGTHGPKDDNRSPLAFIRSIREKPGLTPRAFAAVAFVIASCVEEGLVQGLEVATALFVAVFTAGYALWRIVYRRT